MNHPSFTSHCLDKSIKKILKSLEEGKGINVFKEKYLGNYANYTIMNREKVRRGFHLELVKNYIDLIPTHILLPPLTAGSVLGLWHMVYVRVMERLEVICFVGHKLCLIFTFILNWIAHSALTWQSYWDSALSVGFHRLIVFVGCFESFPGLQRHSPMCSLVVWNHSLVF